VNEDHVRERVRLVELDLEKTNELIRGVVATSATLRGTAVTIWLALMGFTVQQQLAELALLAAIVAALFVVVDGYHGWLYTEASKHARAVERLLSMYYDALSRGEDDDDIKIEFLAALRSHRFGLFLNLRNRFDAFGDIWNARPHVIYRGLYPALVCVALISWGAVGLGLVGAKGEPKPTRVVIEQDRR
jgi:hypothetical protein